MIQRSIVLLPRISLPEVDTLREKYDPLFGKIAPHITLVFPFESRLSSEEIKRHILIKTKHVKPFRCVLSSAVMSEGKYVFLLVQKGKETVKELHDLLYTGPFEDFLMLDTPYVPHITVACSDKKDILMQAAEEAKHLSFEAHITEIIVERISEDGASTLECIIPLTP